VLLGGAPTAFFGKTYDEALALLVEMRDYVADGEMGDRAGLAPALGVRMSCEALRITARLTQIMAWLLAQKAIHAGEVSTEEVIRRNEKLAGIAICMEEDEGGDAALLPARFRALAERSHRLYVRVTRLDEMMRRQVA